jgi:cystathionine gamma-synthase
MAQGPGTRAIHAGVKRDNPQHSISTPVVRSAPFTFANSADLENFMFKKVWGGGTEGREEYGREGNETVNAVEQRLAAIEGGEAAALFASGMSALSTLLLAHIKSGQHIILTDDSYKHTREFCLSFLKRLGVEISIVSTCDSAALENAIRPGITRFIVSESPTNPLLRLADFECIAAIGRKHGVETLIDSTFGTPINQRPLAYGIDYVLHSATKYLGGHHDLIAGVVIGARQKIGPLREARTLLGGILAPDAAFLLERGLRTLALRMERHNDNTLGIARFLEAHPKIDRVWYPGLASHPDHALAVRQMSGWGGVVSFEVQGDLSAANRLIDALRIPYIAVSLGGVESLIGSPAVMAYYDLEPEDRAALGIKDNLLRFAIGTEDLDDLIADLQQALEQV